MVPGVMIWHEKSSSNYNSLTTFNDGLAFHDRITTRLQRLELIIKAL